MKTRHDSARQSTRSNCDATETALFKKKRRKHRGFFRFFRSLLFLLLITMIALIVLSFTGVLGNGIRTQAESTFQNLIGQSGTADTDKSLPSVSQAPNADEAALLTVSESGVTYQGKPIALEDLRNALLTGYQEGTAITLLDHQAIKADYDAVKAILTELGIPFIEQ